MAWRPFTTARPTKTKQNGEYKTKKITKKH